MAWGKKTNSSTVAKGRLQLVLMADRAGTSSNNEMIQMMKADILRVISGYIEIDENDLEIDIKTLNSTGEGVTTELVANIPIRKVKKMGRNTYKKH